MSEKEQEEVKYLMHYPFSLINELNVYHDIDEQHGRLMNDVTCLYCPGSFKPVGINKATVTFRTIHTHADWYI